MPAFPKLAASTLVDRLQPPANPVEIILDTDTDNEIDDQFALTYALLSPQRIRLQAVYAAPYHNARSTGPADGMNKSHDEAARVLDRMGVSPEGMLHRGSDRWMTAADEPVASAAATNLVERVMARPQGSPPLYVVGIGAITNIASALLLEPRLIERIVVVWLAGHPFNWHTAREFNLKQDLHASRVMFNSAVPLVFVPCRNVAEHLRLTRAEVDRFVKPRGRVGEYLAKVYADQVDDSPGRSRVIWDMAPIAWLVNPAWVGTHLAPSPLLTDQITWSCDPTRSLIRCAHEVNRDAIFADFFAKLQR